MIWNAFQAMFGQKVVENRLGMPGEYTYQVWAGAMKSYSDAQVKKALNDMIKGVDDDKWDDRFIPSLPQFVRLIDSSKTKACHKAYVPRLERKPTDEEIRNGNQALRALKQSLSK